MKKEGNGTNLGESGETGAIRRSQRGVIESLHPVVTLVYFLGMAAVTMVTLNPVLLCVSFFGAVFCTGTFIGVRKLLSSLAYSLPILALMAVINPLFVHRGETVLIFYNDNPVTLEAIYYGVSAALMIISVFYWFKCYSVVMTSDKTVFLFGKAAPRLALLLSMTFGFIPKLRRQYKKINAVQKSMGMYSSKSITDRVLSRFRALSALIGWALESSVETADSMSARGYGLKGRSSYNTYSWTRRDVSVFAFILIVFAVLITGTALASKVYYYPVFTGAGTGIWDITSYAALTALAMFAAVSEIQENIRWRFLIAKV